MDVNDIRQMIRKSIRSMLNDARRAALSPPKDFVSFRMRLESALASVGSPAALIEAVRGEDCFSEVWSVWSDMESEMSRVVDSSERLAEWSSLVDHHIPDLVSEVAAARRVCADATRLGRAVAEAMRITRR